LLSITEEQLDNQIRATRIGFSLYDRYFPVRVVSAAEASL
jgi:hypothetical protein